MAIEDEEEILRREVVSLFKAHEVATAQRFDEAEEWGVAHTGVFDDIEVWLERIREQLGAQVLGFCKVGANDGEFAVSGLGLPRVTSFRAELWRCGIEVERAGAFHDVLTIAGDSFRSIRISGALSAAITLGVRNAPHRIRVADGPEAMWSEAEFLRFLRTWLQTPVGGTAGR